MYVFFFLFWAYTLQISLTSEKITSFPCHASVNKFHQKRDLQVLSCVVGCKAVCTQLGSCCTVEKGMTWIWIEYVSNSNNSIIIRDNTTKIPTSLLIPWIRGASDWCRRCGQWCDIFQLIISTNHLSVRQGIGNLTHTCCLIMENSITSVTFVPHGSTFLL